MKETKIEQQTFWKIYTIFFFILLFLGFVLIGMTKLTKKTWNEGLKNSVTETLRSKYPDVWVVGNKISLKSPFETSACLFELRNKDSAEKYYVIIVRTPTIYGHMPAVYIYNKNKGVEFVGYSNVKGRVKTLLEQNSTDLSITYWLERIPGIIAKAEDGGKK